MPTLECVNDITNQNNLCLLNLKLDRTEWLITNDLELETAKYKHRHDLVDKGTCWQINYPSQLLMIRVYLIRDGKRMIK